MADAPLNPFERMRVQFSPEGGTRVEWDLRRQFIDPEPHLYRLEGSPTSTPTADDWITIGLPAENIFYATDDARRVCGKTLEWHYRIVLDTPVSTYVSPVVGPLSLLGFRDWRLARDVIRKERIRHTLYTSLAGRLYKRRRFGPPCPRCLEPMTEESTNSSCPLCYGTRILGGYYAPLAPYYLELGLESSREEVEDGHKLGTVKQIVIPGRVLGEPAVSSYDLFVDSGSGRAFLAHRIGHKAELRGYTIVTELELRQVPFSDVVYTLPSG